MALDQLIKAASIFDIRIIVPEDSNIEYYKVILEDFPEYNILEEDTDDVPYKVREYIIDYIKGLNIMIADLKEDRDYWKKSSEDWRYLYSIIT